MDWFNFLFLGAFLAALATGKAYFRGVVTKADDPRQYWTIVIGYLALACLTLFLPIIKHFKDKPISGFDSVRYFMTDAATRAARDLQYGVEHGQQTIELPMRAKPEGCAQDYKFQLSQQSALVIWCIDPATGKATSSHITTSHLPYINVPKTFVLEKHKGESVFVDVDIIGGKGNVLNVR